MTDLSRVKARIGRESEPEETERDEDSTSLTHDKPEHWPDGTVVLDFLKHRLTQTCQLHGEQERYLDTCSKMAAIIRRRPY